MLTLGAAMSQSQSTQALSQNDIQFNPILNIFSDAATVSPTQEGGGASVAGSGVTSTSTATAKPSVSTGFGGDEGGGEGFRSGYLPTSFMPSNIYSGSMQPGTDPDSQALFSESIAGMKARYIGGVGVDQSFNPLVLVGGVLVIGAVLYYAMR